MPRSLPGGRSAWLFVLTVIATVASVSAAIASGTTSDRSHAGSVVIGSGGR
ncbi:MAG TPA: hypothetical protein VJL81_11280 [Solirubrobacterales bacterium]|nr:hypothetical protein [Solirubrobacterales bacterium]